MTYLPMKPEDFDDGEVGALARMASEELLGTYSLPQLGVTLEINLDAWDGREGAMITVWPNGSADGIGLWKCELNELLDFIIADAIDDCGSDGDDLRRLAECLEAGAEKLREGAKQWSLKHADENAT